MKKQRYIVEIEMPDGDFISAGWLKDLIQTDCDVEDESRKKVIVQETSLPFNLDEAAEEYSRRLDYYHYTGDDPSIAFKAGAEWMAGQGVSVDGKVIMDFSEPYDIINRRLIAKLGDALLEIEPGEVVVQIRKK